MALVRFFAAAKAATKTAQVEIDGNSVGEVLNQAKTMFADLGQVLSKCSLLLNETSCNDLTVSVNDSDILDVLPPFAGG